MMFSDYYKGKKVLITGHTGFKGSWLSLFLNKLGAKVYGYSLEPPTKPSLYEIAKIEELVNSEIGDIRDYIHLKTFFDDVNPDIVFHMAAQPLVIDGYSNPRETYEINVMGTVNVLECIRNTKSVKSFVNVTTDKVYENNDTNKMYIETDILDGYDPYSNSKSCSELITHCYKKSYFVEGCSISTARAGNVIGGGDFSDNRIVPDCVRAAIKGEVVKIRNPNSIRPFQHVLDPLCAYMLIAYKQNINRNYAGYYNVGPNEDDIVSVGKLTELFCHEWGCGMRYDCIDVNGPHEANFLKLNCTKIKKDLGFVNHWDIETAIKKTVEWTKSWISKEDVRICMEKQIDEYIDGVE